MKLAFRGGSAYGPNGRFGAGEVSVDPAGNVTIAGDVLGQAIKHGPEPLKEAEAAALDKLLDEAATVDGASKRMGVPGESMIHFELGAPSGPQKMFLWHREALERPPFAGLLRWLDALIQARTGHFAAFGS